MSPDNLSAENLSGLQEASQDAQSSAEARLSCYRARIVIGSVS